MVIALAGFVGFAIGVAAMAAYSYSVAYLTLCEEEKRTTQQSGEGDPR